MSTQRVGGENGKQVVSSELKIGGMSGEYFYLAVR